MLLFLAPQGHHRVIGYHVNEEHIPADEVYFLPPAHSNSAGATGSVDSLADLMTCLILARLQPSQMFCSFN